MAKKKPVVAWIVKLQTVDGFILVGARTERGALGFVRRDVCEMDGEGWQSPNGFAFDIERLAPMDAWAAQHAIGVGYDLQIAMFQEKDARAEGLRLTLQAAYAALRKGGQGLTLDQEQALTHELVIP